MTMPEVLKLHEIKRLIDIPQLVREILPNASIPMET